MHVCATPNRKMFVLGLVKIHQSVQIVIGGGGGGEKEKKKNFCVCGIKCG